MKQIFTFLLIGCFTLLMSMPALSQEAYMGVHYNRVHKKKASKLKFEKPYGAYVTNVVSNSPAEKINLQPFDYIYKIGDFEFTEDRHFGGIMDEFKTGDQSTVYFVRSGEKMSKAITFGTEAESNSTHRSAEQDPFLGIAKNHDDLPNGVVGVPVNITRHSTAEKIGMQNSDVITHINDYPIYDMHDAGTAIDMLEVGESISVKFLRDEKEMQASEPIQSLAATRAAKHATVAEVPVEDLLGQIENVDITMEDMPEEEAEEMKKERGIDMPVIQDLALEQLKIFPNPNQGIFNLEFNLLKKGATAVRIFNATGQLVFANDYNGAKGEMNIQIDLSNNSAGAYYLMIQQRKNSVTKKVVIVRD